MANYFYRFRSSLDEPVQDILSARTVVPASQPTLRSNPKQISSYPEIQNFVGPYSNSANFVDQKTRTCTPRCAAIMAIVLLVGVVIALSIGIVTRRPLCEDVPTNGSTPTDTGSLMYRGLLSLENWVYHPDLSNTDSALFKAYESILCDALMEQALSVGLKAVTCHVTEMNEGSVRPTYVLTFNDTDAMTSQAHREMVTSVGRNLVNNNPAFTGRALGLYADACALASLGDRSCEQICSVVSETDGDIVCSCEDGYELADDSFSCSDIDECSRNLHSCSHDCSNTEGSYDCSCPEANFTLGNDGRTCEDINECSVNNGGCTHICQNTYGSYSCSCFIGHQLASDGKQCIVINC